MFLPAPHFDSISYSRKFAYLHYFSFKVTAMHFLLLPGTELPLVESFGLLNDLFPFPSILDAGYPVLDL